MIKQNYTLDYFLFRLFIGFVRVSNHSLVNRYCYYICLEEALPNFYVIIFVFSLFNFTLSKITLNLENSKIWSNDSGYHPVVTNYVKFKSGVLLFHCFQVALWICISFCHYIYVYLCINLQMPHFSLMGKNCGKVAIRIPWCGFSKKQLVAGAGVGWE